MGGGERGGGEINGYYFTLQKHIIYHYDNIVTGSSHISVHKLSATYT